MAIQVTLTFNNGTEINDACASLTNALTTLAPQWAQQLDQALPNRGFGEVVVGPKRILPSGG